MSRLHAALAAVLLAALYLAGLGSLPLQVPDEPREAEIAREMWAGGKPLDVPRLNGEPATEYPPLVPWAVAAVFAAEGEAVPGPVAVRLAPVIFTLATILATFLLARGWFSTRHGALAALILAVSPLVLLGGRRLSIEPALACFLTIAVGSSLTVLRAVRGRRFLGFLACAGAGLALAYLAAGPIAVAFAFLAVAGAIVAERGVIGLFRLRALILAGVAALFLLSATGLWLFILARAGGEALAWSYLAHHLAAFSAPRGGSPGPWWFHLAWGFQGFLPFAFFLPLAKAGRTHALAPGGHPEFRLRQLAVWCVLPLVLLSFFGEKRVLYTLPLYPPAAMLAAVAILEPPREGRLALLARGLWVAVLVGFVLGATAVPLAAGIYSAVTGSSGAAVGAGALAAAAAAVIVLARRRPSERQAALPYPFATVSLGAILGLTLLLFLVPASARTNRTVEPLAAEVAATLDATPPGAIRVFGLGRTLAGAIPYRFGRTLPRLERPEEVRALFAANPAARVIFEAESYEAAGRPGRRIAAFSQAGYRVVIAGP